MKMTLSHRYLDANLDLLSAFGFPKTMALEVLGIDAAQLKFSTERLPLDRFVDCIDVASEFTSRPNIALRLGHKFRVGTFAQTGSLYTYCRDLSEVIQMNNRYQKLAIDAGAVEYSINKSGRHKMCFKPHYEDMEKYRPITDMIMASYVTTYSWLTWGSGEEILSAHLPYPEPEDVSVHQDVFQSDLIFGSDSICLEFSETAAAQRFTTHDPEKLTQAKVALDRMMGLQMESQAFEAAVEAAIRGALSSGQVSSHIVADRMGMSWSTLRTRLDQTGEGMRARVDRIRKSLFMEKYQAGESFAQIAMSLAYNDQPAMNRAFRRWFDMTPSQWRKAQADKSS